MLEGEVGWVFGVVVGMVEVVVVVVGVVVELGSA